MRVVVFGSANYDISLWVPRLPAADETLHATRLEEFCGGKGANQATAAARLGAAVELVACVGHDAHGDTLVAALERNGVGTRHVHRVDAPTGMAFPIIGPDDVCIVIARGANALTGAPHAELAASAISAADVLLLQGEVGGAGAGRAAAIAREAATTVVFNPAPVVDEVVAAVAPLADVVVVNRQERPAVPVPPGTAVVLTLGGDGAVVDPDGPGEVRLEAFPTTVVDPTGAGDAFCGALAVGLAEGADLVAAARFACAAGALAVQVAGAEPSMPTRAAVDALGGTRTPLT